jgi:hypothetical protein
MTISLHWVGHFTSRVIHALSPPSLFMTFRGWRSRDRQRIRVVLIHATWKKTISRCYVGKDYTSFTPMSATLFLLYKNIFLGAKSTFIRDCVSRSVGWSVCPHDAITWKTSYVAIASRRGGRGKLVTSRFLRT